MNLKCEKCGWEGHPNLEETGPHTKATCGGCGAYIKMLSKVDVGKLIEATYRSVRKEQKAAASKPKIKRVIMDRGDALDTYLDIRDKVKDMPDAYYAVKQAILVQLVNLAESHSAALSRIEELENAINDPLFGRDATDKRVDQMSANFNFLLKYISMMHDALKLPNNGDWQKRANMVYNKVKEMAHG